MWVGVAQVLSNSTKSIGSRWRLLFVFLLTVIIAVGGPPVVSSAEPSTPAQATLSPEVTPNATAPPPIRDRYVPGLDPQYTVDVYKPATPAPTVVVIHGGGWVGRDKVSPQVQPIAEQLAQDGFAVFNINFRLATPALPGFSAQTDDIATAVQWVIDNAAKYNARTDQIGLIGGSSGAQLAALAGELINIDNGRRVVTTVVSMSGVLDFYAIDRTTPPPDDALRPGLNTYLGCVPSKCKDEDLNNPSPSFPGNIDGPNGGDDTCPSFMLVNGTDELVGVEQPTQMDQNLRDAGCDSTLRIMPSIEHGFRLFDDLEPEIAQFFGIELGAAPTLGGIPYPAKRNLAYSFAYTTLGPGPITVSLVPGSGDLPPGLTLSSSGVVSGTATVNGKYYFDLVATSDDGSDEFSTGIEVRNETTTIGGTPTPATVGQYYAFSFSVSGPDEPVVSLSKGRLPPGLVLAPNGAVTGTPTQEGTFSFTVRADTEVGTSQKDTRIVVNPASAGPIKAGPPLGVTATAGDARATVSWIPPANDGGSPVTEYWVAVRQGSDVVKTVKVRSGTATSTVVRGLTNGTRYDFRVSAVNGVGRGPQSTASNEVVPTASAGDSGHPTVVSRTPVPNATGVSRVGNVTATFDEAVTGVSATTVLLRRTDGGATIPASVTYNATSMKCILNPDVTLPPGAQFTVTLTSGIVDAAGNTLDPVSWSFTTR